MRVSQRLNPARAKRNPLPTPPPCFKLETKTKTRRKTRVIRTKRRITRKRVSGRLLYKLFVCNIFGQKITTCVWD